MRVAGIGCQRGASVAEILDAIAQSGGADALDALAAVAAKQDEPGLTQAAARLGVPLILADPAALAGTADRLATRSAASLAAAGTPSASEAAALAVAGPTARLLAPRRIVGRVTCAIAVSESQP